MLPKTAIPRLLCVSYANSDSQAMCVEAYVDVEKLASKHSDLSFTRTLKHTTEGRSMHRRGLKALESR